MNNEQFRRLIGAPNPSRPTPPNHGASPSSASPAAFTPRAAAALGSKQRSSIPMTPRSVSNLASHGEFQRQLAERNATAKAHKKPKTSLPKGSKFAQGYTDRARERGHDDDEAAEEQKKDGREARIGALAELLKKGEIDQATFDRLQGEIVGGDLESTHLVKGLDFKLLERVRRGENVWDGPMASDEGAQVETKDDEPSQREQDDAFEKLEDVQVDSIQREKTLKKGHLATTGVLKPGQKRSRNMILAEMKAAREAAKAKEESSLGSRFKKIGAIKTPGSRIERDGKGREVLIVVDEDGHEKRKVRKVQSGASIATHSTSHSHKGQMGDEETEAQFRRERELMVPNKAAKPLGMEVPEMYRQKEAEPEEEKDVNIFDDVGDDYDPLSGLDSSSDEEDGDDEATTNNNNPSSPKDPSTTLSTDKAQMPPPPSNPAPSEPRNYFHNSKTHLVSSESLHAPSLSDPAIQAALKKAATLRLAERRTTTAAAAADNDEEDDDDGGTEARENREKAERRRRMLQNVDRDAEDMDMGFGTSRFEDEADLDEGAGDVRLARWGDGDEDGDDGGGGGKQKRKRGGKKRKGDGNNAADVMRVLERRRAAG